MPDFGLHLITASPSGHLITSELQATYCHTGNYSSPVLSFKVEVLRQKL
jgi:hypothetical protein